MAAVEKPQRAIEFQKAKAEAAESMSDMDIDAPQHIFIDKQDLYTRLKVWQRQLEFYEIQVAVAFVSTSFTAAST